VSIRAVTDLAAKRDEAGPTDKTAQYSDLLTKTIPTESLTANTVFIASIETFADKGSLLGWRWGAFGGFIVLTLVALLASYYSKARATRPAILPAGMKRWGRWTPYELIPVLIATIAWGLAMPGAP